MLVRVASSSCSCAVVCSKFAPGMKGVVRSLEMLFEYEAVYQSPMPELERDRVKAIVVDSEERRRRRLVSLG
jgi:hypothetical protein